MTRASASPCGDALRVPTIATRGAANASTPSPSPNSTAGRPGMSSWMG